MAPLPQAPTSAFIGKILILFTDLVGRRATSTYKAWNRQVLQLS